MSNEDTDVISNYNWSLRRVEPVQSKAFHPVEPPRAWFWLYEVESAAELVVRSW